MTKEKTEMIEGLFIEYSCLKEGYKARLKEICNTLISNTAYKYRTNTVEASIELLLGYSKISKERKRKSKNESCDFNVLSLFHIDEPKHSSLLAFLLNPYESHGQGNLFLKNFLKKLCITNPESNNWTVTTEKGRIDILLTRINPHSIVIVENKSNRAVDQPFQLYRYWYHQIHKRKLQIDYSTDEYKQKYQIIFLTPHHLKTPTDNSLSKPDESYGLADYFKLPNKVPIKPKIWEFSKEVSEVLEISIEQIPTENHRLREYVTQYIEIIKSLN